MQALQVTKKDRARSKNALQERIQLPLANSSLLRAARSGCPVAMRTEEKQTAHLNLRRGILCLLLPLLDTAPNPR